jgi:glycosyltransferase involved in cell wall biosynthesis
MTNNKLVSIIIPTRNSASTIEECLISLKKQTYKNIEIIVIDNNSTDDTKKISKKYTDSVYNFWPERTFQKNYWINIAKWAYIFFVDSDMKIWDNVLKSCMELYDDDNNIWWIIVPEKSIWNSFFVKIRDFERQFYKWTDVESARFFNIDNVKNVWWFDEDIIFFEESILPQKIEKLWLSCKFRINDYIEHNEYNFDIFYWLKKKYYYGKSLWKYKYKSWNVGKNQAWIFGRYMIFLKNKDFYKRPILALGVLFLKTLEFWSWWLWYIFNKYK